MSNPRVNKLFIETQEVKNDASSSQNAENFSATDKTTHSSESEDDHNSSSKEITNNITKLNITKLQKKYPKLDSPKAFGGGEEEPEEEKAYNNLEVSISSFKFDTQNKDAGIHGINKIISQRKMEEEIESRFQEGEQVEFDDENIHAGISGIDKKIEELKNKNKNKLINFFTDNAKKDKAQEEDKPIADDNITKKEPVNKK